MNVAEMSLKVAQAIMPTWNGAAYHNEDEDTLNDPRLARSTESFKNGTLWAIFPATEFTPMTISVFEIEAHTANNLILTQAPDVQIQQYSISTIPFSDFLHIINQSLVGEWDTKTEEIEVDTVNVPDRYEMLQASDVRRVEIIPVSTSVPTIHHYWHERSGYIEFYKNTPTLDGDIKLYYNTIPDLVNTPLDELPKGLRPANFIWHCVVAYHRMIVQKVGKDGKSNYDLVNDAKDMLDSLKLTQLGPSTSPMDYDIRYRQ